MLSSYLSDLYIVVNRNLFLHWSLIHSQKKGRLPVAFLVAEFGTVNHTLQAYMERFTNPAVRFYLLSLKAI